MYRVLGIAAIGLMAVGCQQQQGMDTIDTEQKDQVLGYTLGHNIGSDFNQQDLPVNPQAVIAGFKDGFHGNEAKLDQEQMSTALQSFREEMMAKQMAARQNQQAGADPAAAQGNLQEGEQFLAENAKKEGVQVTDSGLQYKVLEAGSGASPTAEDMVKVHYTGRLLDGTVFDSSVERGEPATFPLGSVIPGWTEGLQLMQEGGEVRLFVPADLAYGEQGAGGKIGPNETLIFDVELLEVQKQGGGGQ